MRNHTVIRGQSALAWLIIGAACGDPVPSETVQPSLETETDGVFTTGVDGGDGADDTAGPEPVYCITNDDNPDDLEGVKHMCDITYDLDLEISVNPVFGSNYVEGNSVTSVQTLDPPSTYDHPFASACCTDITDHPSWPVSDTCGLIHQRACMSDFIEHICHAPGSWLFKLAHNGIGVGSGEEAIQRAANTFTYGDLKQRCIDHFMAGADDLINADLCGTEFSGSFEHEPFTPGDTWTYLGNEAFDLTITLTSSFATGGVEVPPSPPETCGSAPDNNGEIPPFSGIGSAGSFVAPVGDVPIEVYGPEYEEEDIEGTGELGGSSRMHRHINSTAPYSLFIDQWVMYESSASVVGTSSVSMAVDHFKLELVGASDVATNGTGGWTLAAGDAVFNLAASIGGVGYVVPSINDTAIVFDEVASGVDDCPTAITGLCLVSSAFSIEYTDQDAGVWTLDVPEITWKPD